MTTLAEPTQALEDQFGPTLTYCTEQMGNTSVTSKQLADTVWNSLQFLAVGGETITLLEDSASNVFEAEIMMLVGSYAILNVVESPEQLDRAFQLIRPVFHHIRP